MLTVPRDSANGENEDPRAPQDPVQTLTHLWMAGLIILILVGLALTASQSSGITAALGIGILILFAAVAVGAVLGFLFAIPRVLASDQKDGNAANNPATPAVRRFLQSNSNLDKVSDWLTTMIVGVGLTQLGNINGALLDFRRFLAVNVHIFPAPGGANAGALPAVGPMLILIGTFVGFISLYLFTRLRLSALFLEVEKALNDLSKERATRVKQVAQEAALEPGGADSVAVQAVLHSPQPSVEESIGLMFSLLYRPGGYHRVIELGGQLSGTSAARRADFWFYLAAAFGQQHHALLEGGDADRIRTARLNALDCARRAVTRDPKYRARLWNVANPDGVDDDLADFRDDPEFRNIVGEPPNPPAAG